MLHLRILLTALCELRRVSRKHKLMPEVRQINPTGKSLKTLSIPSRKNIPLASSGKSVI